MVKKRIVFVISILLLSLLFLVSCAKTGDNEKPTEGYENNLLMVYLCGSDLESRHGRASANIEELLKASIPTNTKVVIQTGGTSNWKNEEINPYLLERYEISNGELLKLDSKPLASMGEKESLYSFLDYCNTNFEKTNKALILWNHGGGATKGCCFDENYSFDSLSISEIVTAISESKIGTLDFIGFDACLMGSIEVAYALKDYARYMIASEESEPGGGWDFETVANSYGEDSLEKTVESIVDSYYAKCEKNQVSMNATLSAINLSKINDVANSFGNLFKQIKESINDIGLWQISKSISSAPTFGGRSDYETKSNIVDLYKFADNLTIYENESNALIRAINNCVLKKKNGALKEGCGGLSFYYPYKLQSDELQQAKDIVVSSEYKEFLLDNFISISNDLITFDDKGSENEHGAFEIKLNENSVKYVRSVKYSLLEFIQDDQNMLVPSIGTDVDVYNESYGVYASNFKGRWVCFNGEELQCTYLGDENGYAVYSSRIKLNGEEKYLRFAYSYLTKEFVLLGTWSGINEQGMADKAFDKLNNGDVIIPLYYYYDENFERTTVEGNRIVYGDGVELSISPLKQTYYQYVFVIEDIFGRLYYSYTAVLKMNYTYEQLLENPLTEKYDFAAEIYTISQDVTLIP